MNQPGQVEQAVTDPREMGVPAQVIHAIRVNFSADDLFEQWIHRDAASLPAPRPIGKRFAGRYTPVDERTDGPRILHGHQIRIFLGQRPDGRHGIILMGGPAGFIAAPIPVPGKRKVFPVRQEGFERMGKGRMPNIVQQAREPDDAPEPGVGRWGKSAFPIGRGRERDPIEDLPGEVHHTQGMTEAGVRGPGKNQGGKPQLGNVPQTLNEPVIDEGALTRVERNGTVQRAPYLEGSR